MTAKNLGTYRDFNMSGHVGEIPQRDEFVTRYLDRLRMLLGGGKCLYLSVVEPSEI